MRFHHVALLAAPLLCWAQDPTAVAPPPTFQAAPKTQASPQVDQALRARAKAFLEYQTQGNFRKAYDLVAEDSKDFYFGAAKQKALSYTLDEVQYSDDFSSAAVRSTIKRQIMVAGHPVEIPQIETSFWKLEKGEWVWFHDPSKEVTHSIFGETPADAAEPGTPSPLPKDLSQKAAAAAAAKIVPQAAVDKKSVTFTLGKEATEQVKFHNSNSGVVRVYVEAKGFADAVTVEPRDSMLGAQADLPVKITYKPLKESLPQEGSVRFTVQPFGSVYILQVSVVREVPAPAPAGK